jgi:hypothetical protein
VNIRQRDGTTEPGNPTTTDVLRWTPWRFVTGFGVVSLLSDLAYEGARSVIGPFLGTLGASAALVGLVTGLGEAFAWTGRLATGPLADRTRAYWPLTVAGYGLAMLAVPALGLASTLWLASILVVAERTGKAIRSPAKDVMLSHAAAAVGRGKGFGVHEALDQIGAIAGPLTVAALLAATADDYRTTFLALALPGAAVMVLLLRLRVAVPDPARFEPAPSSAATTPSRTVRLPRRYWTYLAFAVTTTTGYATFGVLAFHLANRGVLSLALIPVVYAGAMGVDALAALASGWLYDRAGQRVLAAVPILSTVALLAFTTNPAIAITGVLVWGAVLGIQESTMRAAVADLVPHARRGTAYGIFAGVRCSHPRRRPARWNPLRPVHGRPGRRGRRDPGRRDDRVAGHPIRRPHPKDVIGRQ